MIEYYVSESGNTILRKASAYVYEQNSYILKQGSFNLESSTYRAFKKPLKEKFVKKYIRHRTYTTLITLEWIGAPELFLKKNNFSILDSDRYKEFIKLKRKKK